MKVTKVKNKQGKVYYYIQDTVYSTGGHIHSKTIRKLGSWDEIHKDHEDPEAYAHEICDKMNAEAASKIVVHDVKYDFSTTVKSDGQEISKSLEKNIGYFFLQEIYNQLNLESFFRPLTADSRIRYKPAFINGFLTYDRILNPGSKLHFVRNQERYYEDPQIDYHDVLGTMDLLSDNYEDYLAYVFKTSNRIVERDTTLCYYDCTNYYMEKEEADEEYIDEVTGEIMPGLCQYGPSKEHRPNPVVEMGLMMDRQGIPITMCIEPGNRNEQLTAIPLEKTMSEMLENSSFIYVSDGGLGSYKIRDYNSKNDRHFVVTQSIKKLSNVLKDAVFNDYDYRLLSDGSQVSIEDLKSFDKKDKRNLGLYNDRAFKIITADKATDTGLTEKYTDQAGRVRTRRITGALKQSIIITFSRKMMEYQRAVRSRQIERAKRELNNLDPDTYKKGPNDVTRFIKKTTTSEDGSKLKVSFELDQERIAEEEKYDGYYAIATNLPITKSEDGSINNSVNKILGIAATRNKIEECFRIEKTNFSARPVYHYLPGRIKAHFLICYTALLIYRLIEVKIEKAGGSHHTIDSIIETLRNLNVVKDSETIYKSVYTGSTVLDDLNKAFNSDIDKQYYRHTTLNRLKKHIDRKE